MTICTCLYHDAHFSEQMEKKTLLQIKYTSYASCGFWLVGNRNLNNHAVLHIMVNNKDFLQFCQFKTFDGTKANVIWQKVKCNYSGERWSKFGKYKKDTPITD
jgi:hypothetical protein